MIRASWRTLILTVIRIPALSVCGGDLVRKYGYRLSTPEGVLLLNDPPQRGEEPYGFPGAVAELRAILGEAGGVPDAALSWDDLTLIANHDWDDSHTMELEEVRFPFANLREMRVRIRDEAAP